MKRILVNALHSEEVRVATVSGQTLQNLSIESSALSQQKGNIYKGVITRVEPSLEAAFVNYGEERHGFLPFKEIAGDATPSEGDQHLVQISKVERGDKGAALTTFIGLPGRYSVLLPGSPGSGGISQKIQGDDRAAMRKCMARLNMPEDAGLILRTTGTGRTQEELQWDLDYLSNLWDSIRAEGEKVEAPRFLFQDSHIIIRTIRDRLLPRIDEMIIDDERAWNLAHSFVSKVMPEYLDRVKLYDDTLPLFDRYQVESQIQAAFSREVQLPSGGSLVFDRTEALVAIDVNSSRATKGGDIEETALRTNLEASHEVARQLRLRDLGGIVVIDFIDMTPAANRSAVEKALQEALESDPARLQLGRISQFGLLEMSRQRLSSSLEEDHYEACARCQGTGHVRRLPSLALAILRHISAEAQKEQTVEVSAWVPPVVAEYLRANKQESLHQIEVDRSVRILIKDDPKMKAPHYEVRRGRAGDTPDAKPVYVEPEDTAGDQPAPAPQTPALSAEAFIPDTPPPPAAPAPIADPDPAEPRRARRSSGPGIWGRMLAALMSLFGTGRQSDRRRRGGRRHSERSQGRHQNPGRRRRGPGRRMGGQGGDDNRGNQGRRSHNRERGERGNRSDRSERGDRGERGNRGERGERGNRSDRGERGNRSDQGERGNRSDRGERGERGDRGGRRRSPRDGAPRRGRTEDRRPRRNARPQQQQSQSHPHQQQEQQERQEQHQYFRQQQAQQQDDNGADTPVQGNRRGRRQQPRHRGRPIEVPRESMDESIVYSDNKAPAAVSAKPRATGGQSGNDAPPAPMPVQDVKPRQMSRADNDPRNRDGAE